MITIYTHNYAALQLYAKLKNNSCLKKLAYVQAVLPASRILGCITQKGLNKK
jgi:hypothetical protein